MAGGLGVSGHSQGRAASPDWEGIQASDGSTALGWALLEPEDGGRELEVWCGGGPRNLRGHDVGGEGAVRKLRFGVQWRAKALSHSRS